MPQPPGDLSTCEVSPVLLNNKHVTPRRSKRKTPRRDVWSDVYTAGTSTPNSQSPQVLNRSLSSPPPSFPYSQENCPDVIWDYNSPKLSKGSRKREIKLTIQELIDNLHHSQIPEGDPQPGQYIKLLENWMAKQTVDTATSTENKKVKKKQPRRAIEELKNFIDSITSMKQGSTNCADSSQVADLQLCPGESNLNASKLNTSAHSFLDGDSTENDSTEELWGDADNSFIVKATQELESVVATCTTNNNEEVLSTIPETAPTAKPSRACLHAENADKNNSSKYDNYSSILEQFVDTMWDSDDEWDKGFLEDDLTHIPEDVLTGTVLPSQNERTLSYTYTEKSSDLNHYKGEKMSDTKHASNNKGQCANNFDSVPTSSGFELTRGHLNSAELFNSFEDESFEDASLLCQPDVLSRIDEVESMMSQQPKCTPEEIEKKKDEAIKRRKIHK